MSGFHQLVSRVEAGDVGALEEFYRQAVALHADRVPEWRRMVEEFEADDTQPNPYGTTEKGGQTLMLYN